MWVYDDNGYLVFVKLPNVERCKMCGVSYKRDVRVRHHANMESHDTCPGCGFVSRSSDSIEFMNTLLRKAVN